MIIVEGKHDSEKIKKTIDCDVIVTNGTHISKTFIEQCKKIQEQRGVILFTDPDYPGGQIRKIISSQIKGCKHAFIQRDKAATPKKVGVEHADSQSIKEALQQVSTFVENQETLHYEEFVNLGLIACANSREMREQIVKALHIEKCNAKTLFKRLNMLGCNKGQLEAILSEGQ